jgi:hypothetical protein
MKVKELLTPEQWEALQIAACRVTGTGTCTNQVSDGVLSTQVKELLTAEQWEAIRDVASPASYFV